MTPVIFDKAAALTILRERQVAKFLIDYSGGNDEGGPDATRAIYTDGREETNPDWCQRTFVGYDFDPETKQFTERDPLSPEQTAANEAADMLEQPIYDRYYSFAGEFYVDGTLTYDVIAGTVVMTGEEEVPQSDDFEVTL